MNEWEKSGGVIELYVPPSPKIPDEVPSRQFFLQLEISGLSVPVKTWVGQQSELVQIAFEKSAKFQRKDSMLQQGFAALKFTTEQIDQFFAGAAAL